MIEINKDLKSPVRSIDGKVEVVTTSTVSVTDTIINLTDVDTYERTATVDKEAYCIGKNLIDYKHAVWGGEGIVEYLTDEEMLIEVTNNSSYIRLYPEENKWIKNGTKYTFSQRLLYYSDVRGSSPGMGVAVVYSDDSYTEDVLRFSDVITRKFVTITTDTEKEIKYIELRSIIGFGVDTVIAGVTGLQLSIDDNISYEEYKAPVASTNGQIELFTPISTIYTADKAEVNLVYTGSTKNTYTNNDILKSVTVERVGESKFFGFGVCQKANIKLLDIDRALTITTDKKINIFFDDINSLPEFYVTEVHRDENTNELSITAYDALYNPGLTFGDLELTPPYNVENVASEIASKMGLQLWLIETPPDAFIVNEGANYEDTEGVREILNDIAETTLSVYYIGSNKRLVFKALDKDGEAKYTIDKGSYFTLDSGDNRRLTALASVTELGDNIEASLAVSGTTQYIRDNGFLNVSGDGVASFLNEALAYIGGLTINQFNCNWRGNYGLEIGDKIALEAKDNSLIYSYLLDDVIEYDGSYRHTSGWKYEDNEGETASNAANLGEALKQTFAKVDKVNKQIELVASDTESNKESISSLQITTDNITASVSSVSKDVGELTETVNAKLTEEDAVLVIQKELANGVDKIVTTTGFTFNDEGLTVSKSGSEITTQITEDGMAVFRDSGEVLTADNKGVKAENLHAITYLIVGVNSRLENYDNGSRTGCFWIG